VFFVVYSLVEKTKPILIVRRANSRLVNWRIRELVVDSRLRRNDKQQISAFICVNLRLMKLKKQSQFVKGQNELKCIYERRL